jgi:putative nucleotidyltransferase with HDIG domain
MKRGKMEAMEANQSLTLRSLMEQGREAEGRGDWSRALEAYEAAFSQVGRHGTGLDLVQLLQWLGAIHREVGDVELASDLFVASVEIARAHGLTGPLAAGLKGMAGVEHFSGDPVYAEALYEEARSIASLAGDDRTVALVEQSLGSLSALRGDVPAALFSYTSALLRYRRIGDMQSATGALNSMGHAHVELGEFDAATTCYDQAYELANSARDLHAVGCVQSNRAELFLRRQQYEQARQCCDDSFSIFTQLESKTGLAEAYRFYGVLYRETGKGQLADIHFGLALNLSEQADHPLLQAEVHHDLARLYFEEGRNLDAINRLNRAHRLFSGLKAGREVLEINRQVEELERTYLHVVQRWGTEAIESKDPYTLGHSERVAEYALQLAMTLGFSARDLVWLRIGAFLHDVGKTVLPDSLLAKPGVLNESEWGLMKQHTLVGDEIVAGLDFPRDIRPIVRSHHERWDGHGYPDGLRAEQIPLEARILAVADVFDALTSARSYRTAFTADEARRILTHQAGRALDEELVTAFRTLLSNGVVSL